MLKLIPALVAVVLFVSPTLAQEKSVPALPGCTTPDKLIDSAPAPYKYKSRIEGDKLAKLVKLYPDIEVPSHTDLLLIFTFADPHERLAVQVFEKGCHIGNGWIRKEVFDKVMGEPDGKI